jgi:putative hydroxymethylpyrimidine transporter CytX
VLDNKTGVSSWAVGLMWAGIAISMAEIWAGHQMGPAGFAWGIVVILVGHVLGGAVTSAAGIIGTRHRVMAMASTRLVLGNRGSAIPSLLNVLQLVGWATIMLALSGEIGAKVGKEYGGVVARKEFWIVLIGAGTLAWSLLVGERRSQLVRNLVVVGLLLLTAGMVYVLLTHEEYAGFVKGADADFSLPKGMYLMDLVIAMPISWAPLIADYSRMAKSTRGAFWASFLGYGIMSSVMYVIGLLIFLATGSTDPAPNLMAVMGAAGLAIPAMVLVFASTVTSDFPDIYSSACSLFNIHPKNKPIYTVWATGIGTIFLALWVDLSQYENFLVVIGGVFVPLFALLLADYFVCRRGEVAGVNFEDGTGLGFWKGFRIEGVVIWAVGIAVYFAAQKLNFVLGASITAFAVTAALHVAVERMIRPVQSA